MKTRVEIGREIAAEIDQAVKKNNLKGQAMLTNVMLMDIAVSLRELVEGQKPVSLRASIALGKGV